MLFRKLVLDNKSFYFVEKEEAANYLLFRKLFRLFQHSKNNKKKKMKMVEDEALCNKDKINEHLDSVKIQDLEFQKQQNGPFTKAKEQE